MMERKINETVLMKHMAAEAAFDMQATLATIHPNAKFEDLPVGLILEGRDAIADHYNLWWDAFKIQTDGGTLHWVDNNLLVGESVFFGDHIGDFLGVPPTGAKVRFPFCVIVQFADGLLSGERFYYDLNSIMRQLGKGSVDVVA